MPGVHVTLVLDSDDSMLGVTTHMLNAWGRSFHEACDRAIANLRAVSTKPPLEIADGVEVKVQRHMVQAVMPKGTIKSIENN